jgi:uncharacterized repeat protein (TIGR03809 family)
MIRLVASAFFDFLIAGLFMTNQSDAERGREIIERWCALAEQRLEYLAELFETDRWRRYFSETALLENIREAKSAVATWQMLRTQEATSDNQPIDLSWLGRSSKLQPRRAFTLSPDAAPRTLSFDVRPQSAAPLVPPEQQAPPPERPSSVEAAPWPAVDLVGLQQRYPHLHNAL